MQFFILGYYYILWHYTRAFLDIIKIWMNAFWFVYHFFSIRILFSTLFSPWRRMGENYKKGFDASEFFSSLLINTIMRIVGIIIRMAVIIIGLLALVAVFIGGIIFLIIWLFLPFVIIAMLVRGGIRLLP